MTNQYPPPPPPSNVPPVRSEFARFNYVIIGAAVVFLVIVVVVLTFVVKIFDRVNTEMDDMQHPGDPVMSERFDDQGARIAPDDLGIVHLVDSAGAPLPRW